MSINAELYKQVYGTEATENNEHIKALEKYVYTRRENVQQVIIMPNFCPDDDMTYLMQQILKDKAKDLVVYRGLLVELRPNYRMCLTDLCFLYPQLCKLRGYVELPDHIHLDNIKQKIKQIQELDMDDLINDRGSDEFQISCLYNSIGLYQSTHSSEEWGTSRVSNVLGYDLSCDKYLLHFLIHLLQQDLNVAEFHKRLMTTKVGNSEQTPIVLANDAAKGVVEFITGKDEDECGKWLTDCATNWLYKNSQNFFFFNNCINLLALNKKPCVLQTSQVAGVQLYKNVINNSHAFNFAWPTDTGFLQGYHSNDSLSTQQMQRIQNTFMWNRDKMPFNTSLMQKVNKTNTSEWKHVESTLQVIPDNFYRVLFCRLSTHMVYGRLDAKTLLSLIPGHKNTPVTFPMDKNHLVLDTIIKDYKRVKQFAKIINPEFYDEKKGSLKIPKALAKIILEI